MDITLRSTGASLASHRRKRTSGNGKEQIRVEIPKGKDFRFSIRAVLPLFALFVLSRFVDILNFPIFNDEAIYIQYVQRMHQDWNNFKFISVFGLYRDWKPPLPYWIGSVFLGISEDPLFAVRIASATISIIGFFSIYAFCGYLFNDARKAFWAGLLWILNPMVIFFNRMFVAETFVFSFSAATLLFTYLTISRWKPIYTVPAILFGAMTLLSKQSGQLYILNQIFFSFLYMEKSKASNTGRYYKINFKIIGTILFIMVCSWGMYRAIIPSQYFQRYEPFARMFTFSFAELLSFPTAEWRENLTTIAPLYSHYYTYLSLPLILYLCYHSLKSKDKKELLAIIAYILNSIVIVIYFRYFNEYVYNTSVIIWLTVILCSSIVNIQDEFVRVSNKYLKIPLRYGVPALLILIWSHSAFYYYSSAREYILKIGTPHMKSHYYFDWPSGFWVKEVVNLLKEEKNKIVLADPQLGNPRTSLEVYSYLYPSLKIIPINNVVLEAAPTLKQGTVIAVFKNKPQEQWDDYFKYMGIWKEKRVFQGDPGQTPLYYYKN